MAKVPKITTGTVMVGIKVARQLCKTGTSPKLQESLLQSEL